MSHYVEIKSAYKSPEALVAALEEIVGRGKVEIYAHPQPLKGWAGTGERCHVIVRKVGLTLPNGAGLYGDIGFRRNLDGTYSQFVDDYDRRHFERLPQRYARAVTIQQARRQGFTVTEAAQPDGAIRLTLTRY